MTKYVVCYVKRKVLSESAIIIVMVWSSDIYQKCDRFINRAF